MVHNLIDNIIPSNAKQTEVPAWLTINLSPLPRLAQIASNRDIEQINDSQHNEQAVSSAWGSNAGVSHTQAC